MAIPKRGVKWASLRCSADAWYVDTEIGARPLIGAYLSEKGWLPMSWTFSGYHIGEKEKSNLDLLVRRREI
jgi:hypothetical protein